MKCMEINSFALLFTICVSAMIGLNITETEINYLDKTLESIFTQRSLQVINQRIRAFSCCIITLDYLSLLVRIYFMI